MADMRNDILGVVVKLKVELSEPPFSSFRRKPESRAVAKMGDMRNDILGAVVKLKVELSEPPYSSFRRKPESRAVARKVDMRKDIPGLWYTPRLHPTPNRQEGLI